MLVELIETFDAEPISASQLTIYLEDEVLELPVNLFVETLLQSVLSEISLLFISDTVCNFFADLLLQVF